MKPIEIKVRGCEKCPMAIFNMWEGKTICNHPYNMYDGNKEGEFIEHCPLKETETIIKFVIDGKA